MVGAHWPELTTALNAVFPALGLASSCVSSSMELPSDLFRMPLLRGPPPCVHSPAITVSYHCHICQRRSHYLTSEMLNSLLYFAKLVSPNQA